MLKATEELKVDGDTFYKLGNRKVCMILAEAVLKFKFTPDQIIEYVDHMRKIFRLDNLENVKYKKTFYKETGKFFNTVPIVRVKIADKKSTRYGKEYLMIDIAIMEIFNINRSIMGKFLDYETMSDYVYSPNIN